MHATQDQALHPPLSAYVEAAMRQAVYDKLEDGSFAGRIPACIGVVASAPSLRACEDELQSTLEEWILVALKLGHTLPVLAGIDLNGAPARATLDAL
jgi:predicted RNase H-like HicB family nuclease